MCDPVLELGDVLLYLFIGTIGFVLLVFYLTNKSLGNNHNTHRHSD